MIGFREIVKHPENGLPSLDILVNIYRLQYCLNVVRILYDLPMTITSGYRTKEEHYRIYQTINSARLASGKQPITIPTKSMHLIGAAADVADADGSLKEWVIKNLAVVEDLNLFFENFDYTKTWVHFSIYPPRSGERFFKPY